MATPTRASKAATAEPCRSSNGQCKRDGALLENVALHTPPGTPVTIEGQVAGRDLRLTVSDAGPGVPADARERIFTKYQRLNENSPGVGLGLAIARAAAEAQGGRLWVEDSPKGELDSCW